MRQIINEHERVGIARRVKDKKKKKIDPKRRDIITVGRLSSGEYTVFGDRLGREK